MQSLYRENQTHFFFLLLETPVKTFSDVALIKIPDFPTNLSCSETLTDEFWGSEMAKVLVGICVTTLTKNFTILKPQNPEIQNFM